MRERTVELKFGGFEVCRGAPEETLRVHRGVNRREVVPGKKSCLQLADPIEKFGQPPNCGCWPNGVRYQARYIPRNPAARKSRSIRGASVSARAGLRRCASTRPNWALLEKARPLSASACTSARGVSDRQTDRDRCVKAITRKGKVADPVRGVERPAYQLVPAGRVSRPRHHERANAQVGPRLIARQAAFLDQVISELAEPKSVFVVAKARPGKKGQPDIARNTTHRSCRIRG